MNKCRIHPTLTMPVSGLIRGLFHCCVVAGFDGSALPLKLVEKVELH